MIFLYFGWFASLGLSLSIIFTVFIELEKKSQVIWSVSGIFFEIFMYFPDQNKLPYKMEYFIFLCNILSLGKLPSKMDGLISEKIATEHHVL